jgi:hypothetical protein
MLGYATPHPGQGSRVRHRRPTHEAARTVTTQAEDLPDQRRNGRPRPRRRGLPRQTEHAHGGRLVFTRENARADLGQRLRAQARRNRHAPYPGTGRNRCKATFSATPSRSGARAAPSNSRERSGSCAWERAPRPMCDGRSRKSFSSRALESAATRPVARSYPSVMRGLSPTRSASNGCTRRFSPSAPKNKAKKSSHEEGGRIPRDTKSPPSAVLR